MAGLNKVMIIGNVGSELEMRFTANGSPVTSFRMAINRTYADGSGERQQETDWFSVVAWNKLAETCNQFLTKGSRAYVEGRLVIRSWDGEDGMKRFRPEIAANTVLFLERNPCLEPPQGREYEEPEDELPF